MMTEPQGPIYMCYDAALQEAQLQEPVKLPDVKTAKVPSKIAPESAALHEDRRHACWRPSGRCCCRNIVARDKNGFSDMIGFAETLGAPVVDMDWRLNFPNKHPLDMRMNKNVFKDADLITLLDCRDWERPTHVNDRINRTLKPLFPAHCEWLDIGFADIEISKWATDFQRFPEVSQRMLADTAIAIPALAEICGKRIASNTTLKKRVDERAAAVKEMHEAQHAKWAEEAKQDWDAQPITLARLASEVWDKIKTEDWVLTTNPFEEWATKLWDFRQIVSLAGAGAWHGHADWHGHWHRVGAQRHRPTGDRLPDRW